MRARVYVCFIPPFARPFTFFAGPSSIVTSQMSFLRFCCTSRRVVPITTAKLNILRRRNDDDDNNKITTINKRVEYGDKPITMPAV